MTNYYLRCKIDEMRRQIDIREKEIFEFEALLKAYKKIYEQNYYEEYNGTVYEDDEMPF